MKNWILLFLSTFHFLNTNAQAEFNEKSDEEALNILEQISTKFNNGKGHSIDFEFLIEMSDASQETHEGQLFQAGNKFVLNLNEREIISDGESVWVYFKEENELQINDAEFDEEDDFASPQSIFNLYKSDKYLFAISNYARENGQPVTQIECKPLDDDSEFSKMRLTVLDKSNRVKRFKIFAKDGTRMTMSISDHKEDISFSDDQFSFDESKYPDIIIEDLRF